MPRQLTRLTRDQIDAALAQASTTRHLLFGAGVLGETAALVGKLFPGRPVVIVADERTFGVAGEQVLAGLRAAGHPVAEPIVFPGTPTLRPDTRHVESLRAALAAMDEAPALPLAVGSGTINDLVKRAAHLAGLPYIVVGTAASMDGYTASGAALIHEGVKQTFPCAAPVAVVADLDILRAAPKPMTASGYGDLAGKVTAGADWLVADALGIEPLIPPVWDLVQGPLRDMIADPARFQRGEPAAIEQLFYGLIITGLAIQIAGSTRPASGSEHQFSHLWEMRGLEHEGEFVSHGFKVGLGSIVSTALYDRLLARDIDALDVDAAVAAWPAWPEMAREIRARDDHPMLIERALEECEAKYVTPDALRVRLELLRERWPALRARLREQLLPVDALRELLVAGGCPVTPEQIGLTRAQLRASYADARLIRRRYTVYDVAYEAGLFDVLVGELFAPGGYWAAVPGRHAVVS
jgi:glycerol-1-phosphate dehydrogenase [NAD(P)+]